MAAPGLENLSVLRITRIVEALQDARERRPRRLRFLQRFNRVPAMNGDLMARFVGRVLIADLIAPDSVAGVYSSGKMTFESSQLPKLKIGRLLTETQLDQWNAIRSGMVQGDDAIRDFIGPIADTCLEGLDSRAEALCVAMYRDRLDYDRLGFKASGITWGMPSDLKITPQFPWTDAVNGTPVNDCLNAKLIARTRYGMEFDRATGSTQAFRHAIATAEFQAKAKVFIPAQLTFSNLSLANIEQQANLWESVTGLMWEFNDDRYWYQDTAGAVASARYQPINEVYLDAKMDDKNNAVRDLAAGFVAESLFLGMSPAAVVGANTLAGPRRGPLGYMTFPPDINPPNVTVWGVDCVWPRKHVLQSNAVLNVGAFADTISVGEPF
jgi:hypothetical protein